MKLVALAALLSGGLALLTADLAEAKSKHRNGNGRAEYSSSRDGTPSDYRFKGNGRARDRETKLFFDRIGDFSGG